MFAPGMYGEMFTLLPIYAAAVLHGLISGVVSVRLFTTRPVQLSLRVLLGIVALASLLFCLIAAKPEFWEATASFWAMAAVLMAGVDLAAACLLKPWRATRRVSEWSLRRRIAWLTLGLAVAIAGTLTVLKLRFDIPLRIKALPSFAMGLVVAILALTILDVAAHLAVIRWSRWRRTRAAEPASGA
jgi:hypothetical protein